MAFTFLVAANRARTTPHRSVRGRRATMNRKDVPLGLGLLGLLLFLASTVAMAQTTATTGAIAGVVTDPSGAGVPATKLTLKSVTTGAAITTEVNSSGQYSFPVV